MLHGFFCQNLLRYYTLPLDTEDLTLMRHCEPHSMKPKRKTTSRSVRFKEIKQTSNCSIHMCSCNAVYCNLKRKEDSADQAQITTSILLTRYQKRKAGRKTRRTSHTHTHRRRKIFKSFRTKARTTHTHTHTQNTIFGNTTVICVYYVGCRGKDVVYLRGEI
jgi:hypothetical protein